MVLSAENGNRDKREKIQNAEFFSHHCVFIEYLIIDFLYENGNSNTRR